MKMPHGTVICTVLMGVAIVLDTPGGTCQDRQRTFAQHCSFRSGVHAEDNEDNMVMLSETARDTMWQWIYQWQSLSDFPKHRAFHVCIDCLFAMLLIDDAHDTAMTAILADFANHRGNYIAGFQPLSAEPTSDVVANVLPSCCLALRRPSGQKIRLAGQARDGDVGGMAPWKPQ